MTPEELKKVRIHGFRLRSKYYGSEKKLDAISYRLLNALKVKNPNKFMETFLQAHSYVGETIPSIFIQLLEDKDKFQTIGYAFLLGLNGYGETKKTSEEEKNNEK